MYRARFNFAGNISSFSARIDPFTICTGQNFPCVFGESAYWSFHCRYRSFYISVFSRAPTTWPGTISWDFHLRCWHIAWWFLAICLISGHLFAAYPAFGPRSYRQKRMSALRFNLRLDLALCWPCFWQCWTNQRGRRDRAQSYPSSALPGLSESLDPSFSWAVC